MGFGNKLFCSKKKEEDNKEDIRMSSDNIDYNILSLEEKIKSLMKEYTDKQRIEKANTRLHHLVLDSIKDNITIIPLSKIEPSVDKDMYIINMDLMLEDEDLKLMKYAEQHAVSDMVYNDFKTKGTDLVQGVTINIRFDKESDKVKSITCLLFVKYETE